MKQRAIAQRVAAASLTCGVMLTIVGAPSAAIADDNFSIPWVDPSSVAIEYGEYWGLTFAVDGQVWWAHVFGSVALESADVPADWHASIEFPPTAYRAYVIPDSTLPLGAGTYEFVVRAQYEGDGMHHEGVSPAATVTINPAALTTDLRVVPDPSDPSTQLVTAVFSGRFIEQLTPVAYGGAPVPSGRWSFSTTNAAGEVVDERTSEHESAVSAVATSYAWSKAVPGEQYTVTATFRPSGESAENFVIASPAPYVFTAPEDARTFATPEGGEPERNPAPESPFGLPLWAVLVGALTAVLLSVLIILLGVRLSRQTSHLPGESI